MAKFDTTDTVKKVTKVEFKPTVPPPKPVTEKIPKKVEPPVQKPVAPKPAKKPVEKKKSPSPSYELQEEGPVQQISYVSDTVSGYVRVVSEDGVEIPRFVLDVSSLSCLWPLSVIAFT